MVLVVLAAAAAAAALETVETSTAARTIGKNIRLESRLDRIE